MRCLSSFSSSLSPLFINFKMERHPLNLYYCLADLVTTVKIKTKHKNLQSLIKRSTAQFNKSNNLIDFNLISSFPIKGKQVSAHTANHTQQ